MVQVQESGKTAVFRIATKDKYDDVLLRLSREGVGYGIFLAISAAGFGINDIPSRIGDNLRTVVSLEQADKFKYMEIIRRTHLQLIPETNVKGRGLAVIDDRPLEFQTALSMEAEDDFSRGQIIAAECAGMRKAWKGEPARLIPEIPENPTLGILKEDYRYKALLQDRTTLPFGYLAQDASIAGISLLHNYCLMITGRARTGKTNLLRMLIYAASRKKNPNSLTSKKQLQSGMPDMYRTNSPCLSFSKTFSRSSSAETRLRGLISKAGWMRWKWSGKWLSRNPCSFSLTI